MTGGTSMSGGIGGLGMGGVGMGGSGIGGPGMNGGGLDGANGPVFEESAKEAGKVIDRSDFVVQFIWIPTIERDRKPEDPRVAAQSPGAGSTVPATTTGTP